MSTVLDIAVDPPVLLKPYMRLGEVIPRLSELRIREAPVVDDNNTLVGVLSYRAILSKGAGRDTKVSTVMDPPYGVKASETIDRAIALIASWKARDVVVVDEMRRVVGYVNRFMILSYLRDQGLVPNEVVENVMSNPAVTIQEWESIARARWLMLKNAFSRLPVVDRYDRVVGVITLSDIVDRLYKIRLSRRKGYEWIESEESFLAAPVGEFMSSPPITVNSSSPLIKAVELMAERKVSGLPVVSGDDRIVGVISGIDVLKRYVERFATIYPIEARIGRVVEDELTKTQIEKIVNSYIAAFSRYVNVIDFKLSVKEIKKGDIPSTKEVRRLYQVSAKITTDAGAITAKSACWDLPTCIREAMGIIEKRLRKLIDKTTATRSSYTRRIE